MFSGLRKRTLQNKLIDFSFKNKNNKAQAGALDYLGSAGSNRRPHFSYGAHPNSACQRPARVHLYSCVSLITHHCSDGSKSDDDPLAINKVIGMSAATKQNSGCKCVLTPETN